MSASPKSTDLLIVITGPTASGKTGLALDLAEKYGGEIICADSRTIYRGMDIGTAKPTLEEQARVPHHLIDIVSPGERYTAADFQRDARVIIAEIRGRGRIPFVVGGTGLYIDGLVLDYHFGQDYDKNTRSELEKLSVEALQSLLKKQQIQIPENAKNKRHLIRALERDAINTTRKHEPDKHTFVVAITTESDELFQRIEDRALQMFSQPIEREAAELADTFGWQSEAMTGNIYPIIHDLLSGKLTRDQAIELFINRDKQLVKKQLTWLKRHNYVHWLGLDEAKTYIANLCEMYHS